MKFSHTVSTACIRVRLWFHTYENLRAYLWRFASARTQIYTGTYGVSNAQKPEGDPILILRGPILRPQWGSSYLPGVGRDNIHLIPKYDEPDGLTST